MTLPSKSDHLLPLFRAERFGVFALFAWAVVSTIVGRSFTALIPSPWDGQLFAYMSMEWLHGRIPYLDIWDNKPPGILALIALVFSFFPKSFTALAIVEGVFILGCIATVYGMLRRWGAPRLAAALATSCVAVAANLLVYNQQGTYTEIYLLWPAALSMYFFSKAPPNFQGASVFLAGVFTGLATLFKPVGLSPFLAQCCFLLMLWVFRRGLGLRQIASSVVVNGSGVAVAWLPFIAYFAIHDAAGAMIDACLISPVKYGAAGQGNILFSLRLLVENLHPVASLAACGLVGAALLARRWGAFRLGAETPQGASQGVLFLPLVLLWIGFDLWGALAGGRGFAHYFLPLTLSLSVAAGLTFWVLTESPGEKTLNRSVCAALFVLILAPLVPYQTLDLGEVLRFIVRDEQPAVRPWKRIASQLNALREPSDTLFVWDYLPGIYLATEMRSPTRQLFAFRIFHSPEFHRRFGEEIMRELRTCPPTFVVDGTTDQDMPALAARDSVYREFREFVEKHYTPVDTVEGLNLYRSFTGCRLPTK